MASCDKSDNPDYPYGKNAQSTVLLYSVASNNLEFSLNSDKNEILKGATQIDLNRNNILVYEVMNDHKPRLLRVVKKTSDSCIYEEVKEYDSNISSLAPERISMVINDAVNLYPSESYGIILASHGTGPDPYFNSSRNSESSGVAAYSFGYDRDPSSSGHNEINIDDLADAIPDDLFHFIWFDACYMSNIETIYEMRNKCDYYIGYPTEVYQWGMPYDLVMPYLATGKPDITTAARVFFEYYSNNPSYYARVATVAVVDMAKIEDVADFCKKVYDGNKSISTSSLQNYARNAVGPFYDFGKYTLLKGDASGYEIDASEWQNILDEFVIYKDATPTDFNGRPIDLINYSGISTHNYDSTLQSEKEKYYRSLDWYKRVY